MEVVSTMGGGQLGCELDLEAVVAALHERQADMESDFHGPSTVTVRLDAEGPAITLYRTGTFQIRGTESSEALFTAEDRFVSKLAAIDVPVNDPVFKQKNAVYLDDLDQNLRLEALAVSLGLEHVEYEPEQFPGVIYRPPGSETVLLIFASGKTIISGTTDEAVAAHAVSRLKDQIGI